MYYQPFDDFYLACALENTGGADAGGMQQNSRKSRLYGCGEEKI
jgi:hypothetical protein